ncbi:MAG: dicarboxylate/amino acid:cation symporter [Phycisphaerae bacterium]|nr:dicarboxylate/amino acid:cation symporter [Saprospiraceae bacterium]
MSLTMQMIIATIAGLAAGVVFGPSMGQIQFLGDIFLRLIQMSVVFLVMGAIIESVGSCNPKDLGKIGGKALFLFLITSIIGAAVGLFFVNLIQPGAGVEGVAAATYKGALFKGDTIQQFVNFVPKNVFEAMATGNVIQCIVFAALFGLSLSMTSDTEGSKKLYELIQYVNQTIFQVINIVIKFAPIGIFALLGGVTGVVGLKVLIPLGKFLVTLTLAVLVSLGLLITFVSLYGRLNPIRLLKKCQRTIIVSITTTSSAISLPVQMEDCEERIGISKRVSRLVNPLAMSLNSNGLACTLSIACVTVAQFFGIDLTLQQQIMIVFVSTVVTLGNLLVPGGALVAMAVSFQMTGLPLEGIAILAGVDWFAGIIRTLLNVVGDIMVTLIVALSENEFNREIWDANEDQKINLSA